MEDESIDEIFNRIIERIKELDAMIDKLPDKDSKEELPCATNTGASSNEESSKTDN